MDQGKLNRDEQKKVHDEKKRLKQRNGSTERTNISEKKRRREQDLPKQQQKLDHGMQDEEAKLASERNKIEDRKELEKKEREASKGLQVPPCWKNTTGSTLWPPSLFEMIYNISWSILHAALLQSRRGWCLSSLSKTNLCEMSADINEFYLFHGTSSEMAEVICKHCFDERVASLNGLYVAGSYFAMNSCKSHQYSSAKGKSSNFVMLVCRVAMGSPYCTVTSHRNERRPPDNGATPGRPFDSIFAEHGIGSGGEQHHNEVVVFDHNQVYPEYIVRYTA